MNQKIRTWVMKQIWLSELGRSRVIARIYGPTDEILRFLTFLGVYGYIFEWSLVALFIFGVVTGSIAIGWIYIRMNLYKIEQEFSNQQNPMLVRIEEKVDKLCNGKI